MKRRHFAAALLFLASPIVALARERYSAKTFAEAIPRATDLGERWQPIHPDRWLTVNSASVTAMYERRSNETGKLDASVIADCSIYKTEAEARKMLKAKRAQIAGYPTAVITDIERVTEDAFSSYHKGEEDQGSRVTFALDNVVVTISPSQVSTEVAEKFVAHLKKEG